MLIQRELSLPHEKSSTAGCKISIASSIGFIYFISFGLEVILPSVKSSIFFIRLSIVFFFLAIVPATGTPRRSESFSRSIFIFFRFASSRRFTQTTTF